MASLLKNGPSTQKVFVVFFSSFFSSSSSSL
jgi:hypothetical protein